MRLRNVKDAYQIVASSPYVVVPTKELYGNFKSLFNNDNPICLEIGMGKGDFIIGNAKRFPNINFIGVEKIWICYGKSYSKVGNGRFT